MKTLKSVGDSTDRCGIRFLCQCMLWVSVYFNCYGSVVYKVIYEDEHVSFNTIFFKFV